MQSLMSCWTLFRSRSEAIKSTNTALVRAKMRRMSACRYKQVGAKGVSLGESMVTVVFAIELDFPIVGHSRHGVTGTNKALTKQLTRLGVVGSLSPL